MRNKTVYVLSIYWLFVILCKSQPQSIYRLPTTIKPIHYNLDFYPLFTEPTFEFDGRADILINISRDHVENNYTDLQSPLSIQLHIGPDMDIIETHLNLTDFNDTFIDLNSSTYNDDTEIATFDYNVSNEDILNYLTNNDSSHPSTYLLGHIYVQFEYEMIVGGNRGIYVSTYPLNDTFTVRNLVSSFGLLDARRGFPCFDEPQFKAQFDISIFGPINTTMLSNTAVQYVDIQSPFVTACQYEYPFGEIGRCKEVKFESTPIMSTYLIGVVVGLYDSISATDQNDVLTSVYTPLDNQQDGEFALDAALSILPYFGEIFDFPYTLSKVDHIGVASFPWGAMETWGAIMYQNSGLLGNQIESSDRKLAGIATVVAHEVAHQWFGNLVTNEWWSDTWLHEGFATFFGVDGANVFHPDLLIYSSFLLSLNGVMMNDATIYAGTVIGVDIETYSDAMSQFGSLQYTKAGGVIRMLQYTVGNDSFYGALQEYLQTYQYSTATSDDLFNILETYQSNSGLMMESYTRQAGLPVVYASINDKDRNSMQIELRQQRLVKEGPTFYDLNNTDYGYSNFSRYFDDEELIKQFAAQRWWINLNIMTSDGEMDDNETLMSNNQTVIIDIERVKNDDNEEYYLLNHELKNYYRVNYDDELLKMIINSWQSLSFWNQFNVIADRYELMTYNYASAVSYLELLSEIIDIHMDDEDEDEYLSSLVWNIIISSLFTIDDRFCSAGTGNDEMDSLNEIRDFSRSLLKPLYNKLNGFNIDDDYDGDNTVNIINLRTSVIMALIRFDDEDVIEDAIDIFNDTNNIINNEDGQINNIDPNILQPVITALMASLDRNIYDSLLDLYSDSNNVQKGYIRSAFSTLYKNINLTLDTYEYILRGYIDDEDDILFDLSSSQQISALNSLCACYGALDVWYELTTNTPMNSSNDTDWQILFDRGVSVNTLTSLISNVVTNEMYDIVYRFYYGDDGDLRRNNVNERTVNTTLENIAMNTIWYKNNVEEIADYLTVTEKDEGLEAWEIVLIVIGSFVGFAICVITYVCFKREKRAREKNYTQMVGGYGATEETSR